MRGRVAILSLLLLLSLSRTVAADCSWTPQYSAELRTTALDLAVDGNFLWVATGYGVQLLQNDRIVDTLAVPGNTRVVRPNGTGLAYAGSGAEVHVVRREGNTLQLIRSVPARGTVTDIELAGGYLFVATTGGIDHFDLIDPTTPFRTTVSLATSSQNVTSLAIGRTTLYAADGDTSVETFAIAIPSLPQNTGSIESLPRASYVHFANDWLFVSDAFGQNTDIFSGTNRIARLPFGTASLSFAGGSTYFAAGPDRTLRAVDLTSLTRVAERFEYQLAPTGGTDHAIHEIARLGNTLYLAAGDLGLVRLDPTSIAKPYALAGYTTGATRSVQARADKAWFSNAAGTITEQRIVPGGVELTDLRAWEAGVDSVIRDTRDNGLLTTNGAQATLWALVSTTPTAAATFTFADTIVDAVLSDAHLVALLANASVWYTPGAQTAPQKLAINDALHLARSGSAIAVAEVREEGTTVIHYFPAGDFALPAQKYTIDGAAIGLALDPTRAAVFTFNGINIIELASGNVRVIPDTVGFIPREMVFAGDDLLVLDTRRLLVYDDARTLVRDSPLPADANALDVSGNVAVIATDDGTAAALYLNPVPRPNAPFTSEFYTKVAASDAHVYLFDRDGVDIYSTTRGDAPKYVTSARAAGAIDLAANQTTLFTLAGNGTVTAYSPAGSVLAQAVIADGVDSQPLAIHTARNAVWISLSSGCTSGNCQRKTFVLDPNTLAVTATLTGSVRDVVVTGTRAYALFDTPNELRVLDVADALHPSQVVAVARPSTAISLAHEPGTVHVLGDKLYAFSDTTLTFTGDRFAAMTPDPAQQIRIEGGCAIVTGRAESPELFALPSWTPHTSQFDVPSSMREIALQPGRLFLLTAHSLEVWTSAAPQPMPRRRSVR